MLIRGRALVWVCVLILALFGCNAALDFDALQDDPNKGTGTDGEGVCEEAADCDDGIACTTDKCNAKGVCVNDPNNAACPGFEVCKRGEGCVDIGRECLLDSDCDDALDCTRDYCRNDGTCQNTPDDDVCFDPDNLCIGAMTCDAVDGCIGGFEKQCTQDDEDSCYNRFCDPTTGECDKLVPKPGADDDEDGYCDMNAAFGGDDCQDRDATIHPGATEVCDRLDNDCDGLDDAHLTAKADIRQAPDLSSPSVAFGDGRFAVAWQEGSGDAAAVKVRILGEGACLLTTSCTDDALYSATEVADVTAKGGKESQGASPAMTFIDGKFHVVWIASDTGGAPRLMRTAFRVPPDNTIVLDDPELMSGSDIDMIISPAVGVAQGGLVAGWGTRFTDGSYALQLKRSGEALFTGAKDAAAIGSVDLDCEDDCLVAYDRVADGDREVFLARVTLGTTPAFAEGGPKQISSGAGDSGDPSLSPSIVHVGTTDTWAVAFSDVAATDDGFESDSDIRGTWGDGILDLVTDGIGQHRMGSLVYDGSGFDLVFVNDVQGEMTLQVAFFDGTFTRVDNQHTELEMLDDGTLLPSRLVWTGALLAVAWVFAPSQGDAALRFAAFETCQPET